jgi:hypothetical protein
MILYCNVSEFPVPIPAATTVLILRTLPLASALERNVVTAVVLKPTAVVIPIIEVTLTMLGAAIFPFLFYYLDLR